MYLKSDPAFPHVRQRERQVMIDLLKIERHHTFCDVPAWGGYLAEGVRAVVDHPSQITCVEPSPGFYPIISPDFRVVPESPEKTGLPDATFDRVGSLVGLHHYTKPGHVIGEFVRITKPGGLIGISEVIPGSAVAEFLNGPVNRHTSGHKGLFVSAAEIAYYLDLCHCELVESQLVDVSWCAANRAKLVTFVHNLLGMNRSRIPQVDRALADHFEIVEDAGGARLPWSLNYVVAKKR